MSGRFYPVMAALAAFGTLPFIYGAGLALSNTQLEPVLMRALVGYTLIICSFMAGTAWGLAAGRDKVLILASNFIAVLLWVLWLWQDQLNFMLSAAGCFTLLLVLDYWALKCGFIDRAYWLLRCKITLCVVICLLIIGIQEL
jgi:hypothetical protein